MSVEFINNKVTTYFMFIFKFRGKYFGNGSRIKTRKLSKSVWHV